jgi:hypothetical protein
MNRLLVLCVVGLSITCLYLVYIVFDKAVSATYLELSYETNTRALDTLSGVLVSDWSNLNKSQVLQRLQAVAKERDLNEPVVRTGDEDEIVFGLNRFEFKNDRLIAIK